MNIFVFSLSLLQFCLSYYIPQSQHNVTQLDSLAFGSCYNGGERHSSRLDIFKVIDKHKPDLFMWLGDAAYVRYNPKIKLYDKLHTYITGRWKEFNSTFVQKKFDMTKLNAYYQKFRETYPVVGVWDDNDYAQNDGNKYFPYKEEVKQLYLDFLEHPKDSELRRKGRGLYQTYTFGDQKTHKTIRIVLLDVRFYKSSLFESNRDMLGEEQWAWLDNILHSSTETFTLIASGTQILPIDRIVTECWLPESRMRLLELIAKHKKSGVILLSGDIHNGQILRTPCKPEGIGYHIYEVTSSGLGHYCPFSCDLLIDFFLPSYYKFSDTLAFYNFAKIDFAWGQTTNDSRIKISLIDINNIVRVHYEFKYDHFTYNSIGSGDKNCTTRINRRYKSLQEYFEFYTNKENLQFIFIYLFFLLIGLTLLKLFVFTYKLISYTVKRIYRYLFPKLNQQHIKNE